MQVQGNYMKFEILLMKRVATKMGKEITDCEIILIDSKDYFLNSAAILTTLPYLDIYENVQANLKLMMKHQNYLPPNVHFKKGIVKEITPTKVLLENETIYFDYAVIATGTSYMDNIKPSAILNDDNKMEDFKSDFFLDGSLSVLIIGGGLVGVELAAEIISINQKIQINLATSESRLLERMKPEVSNAALKWLTNQGVKIFLNEKVEIDAKDDKKYLLPYSRITIQPEKVFWCTGPLPNNEILRKTFPNSLSSSGFVKVNNFLQIEECNTIFVIGDLADLPEEKLAIHAINHASYVSKAVKKLVKGSNITKPYKIHKKIPLIVVSLGPDDALLCKNSKLTSQGKFAVSVRKWIYRNLMVKKIKKNTTENTNFYKIKTRISIEPSKFSNDQNSFVTILGFSSFTGSIANLLNFFGIHVNIATNDSVEKNQSELFFNNTQIQTHFINQKIPQTFPVPFEKTKILLIPVPFAINFPEYLESLKPIFISKFNKGILLRIILLHPGYLFEKSSKKFKLHKFFNQIEETIRNIDPGIKIISIRYAPTFELLSLVAENVKKSINMPLPLPHNGIPFVSNQDVFDTLLSITYHPSDYDNNIYNICGQSRINPEKISTTISEAIDCPVIFSEVKSDQLSGQFFKLAGKMAPYLIEWWSKPKFLTKLTNDFQEITGLEPIDFDSWSQLNTHIWV